MSKIPYQFETPIPVYFRKNGWFKNPKVVIFVSWCFSRCSCEKRTIFHDHKEIELEPFEFIFGRRVCSEETGLTEREIRSIISWLCPEERPAKTEQNRKILEKSTSKTTNKFTVYRWLTEVFVKDSDQQNDQQTTSRRPADDHNLEERSKKKEEEKKEKNKKEKIFSIEEIPQAINQDFQEESRPNRSNLQHNIDHQTIQGESLKNKINSKISQEISGKINFREWVQLTQKEHDTLVENFGANLASVMLDVLDSYNTSRQEHYKSDYGALKRGGWVHEKALKQINEKPNLKGQSNADYAKECTLKFTSHIKQKGYALHLGHDYIEFSPNGGNGKVFHLKFQDNGFRDQLDLILRRFGYG